MSRLERENEMTDFNDDLRRLVRKSYEHGYYASEMNHKIDRTGAFVMVFVVGVVVGIAAGVLMTGVI